MLIFLREGTNNMLAASKNCRSIQISESGPLLEKLSKMPWETDQSKVLQGEVAALVEGGELVDRGRRSLQNYTTFPWYLPSRIWLYVLNPQEAAAALRMMTDHLIKLGLCLPSEKTCSRVTALYVLHKHHNMSAEALRQEYLNVKTYIRRQIQNTAKTDTPFLTDLPANPKELPAELYQKVFEDEQPLSPQVDMVQLNGEPLLHGRKYFVLQADGPRHKHRGGAQTDLGHQRLEAHMDRHRAWTCRFGVCLCWRNPWTVYPCVVGGEGTKAPWRCADWGNFFSQKAPSI